MEVISSFDIPKEIYQDCLKYFPRACADTVIKNEGKVLILQRAIEPDKGNWALPGGGIFKGETPEVAAIRKLKEEVGLIVDKGRLKLIGVENYFHTMRQDICITFVLEIPQFNPTLDFQHNNFQWCTLKELPTNMNPVTKRQFELAF